MINFSLRTSSIRSTQNLTQNETDKLLWDFEIQTDHLISARRLDFVIVKKKKKKKRKKKRKKENLPNRGLYRPGKIQNKSKRKRK